MHKLAERLVATGFVWIIILNGLSELLDPKLLELGGLLPWALAIIQATNDFMMSFDARHQLG